MRRVILAEPEAIARQVGKHQFEGAGFTVFSATNGEDLDRCLSQGDPDALVVDRRLAGPSGEMLRRLRERQDGRRTACYVLALLPNGSDRRALLEAGADWYIGKNALITPLPSAVRAALEPGPLPPVPPIQMAPRVRECLALEYCHAGGLATGETLNISQGGMFIMTADPIAAGSLLLLGFSLPGHRPWECFARVVWTREPEEAHPYPSGMGVKFLDLEPEAQTALAAFVDQRSAVASQLT